MNFTKISISLATLSFLAFSGGLRAEDSEEILNDLHGIQPGTATEELCKKKCTGNGAVSSGICSDLHVYMACLNACNPAFISDCQETASKEKYYDLAAEYYNNHFVPKAAAPTK